MESFGASVLISERPETTPNYLTLGSKPGKLRAAAGRMQPGVAKDISRLNDIVHPGSRAILAGFHVVDVQQRAGWHPLRPKGTEPVRGQRSSHRTGKPRDVDRRQAGGVIKDACRPASRGHRSAGVSATGLTAATPSRPAPYRWCRFDPRKPLRRSFRVVRPEHRRARIDRARRPELWRQAVVGDLCHAVRRRPVS